MGTEGYISGYSGEEISLLVDGIKIMALQNLSWKASQSKSLIRGAGFKKAHAMGRGPKEYELDFEVKELNQAVISEAVNAPRGNQVQIKKFRVGDQVFSDLLDLRNLTILVLYPTKNNAQRVIRFTGFEFTDVEGGFAFDDEAVTRKLSGLAMDAEGLV
jgi:hypothetical protein